MHHVERHRINRVGWLRAAVQYVSVSSQADTEGADL